MNNDSPGGLESSRYRDLGPLHDLLLLASPPNKRGRRSVPALAKALGISHQYIYKWVETGVVPQRFVPRLVAVSEGRVDAADFMPYLF